MNNRQSELFYFYLCFFLIFIDFLSLFFFKQFSTILRIKVKCMSVNMFLELLEVVKNTEIESKRIIKINKVEPTTTTTTKKFFQS